VTLWGRNLAFSLDEVYRERSDFCLVLVSKEYLDREWTRHELSSAVTRAVKEKGQAYILPVRVDAEELPGLGSAIHYVSLAAKGPRGIADMLIQKLGGTVTTTNAGLAFGLSAQHTLLELEDRAPLYAKLKHPRLRGPESPFVQWPPEGWTQTVTEARALFDAIVEFADVEIGPLEARTLWDRLDGEIFVDYDFSIDGPNCAYKRDPEGVSWDELRGFAEKASEYLRELRERACRR
jgi:hypothetical protein